MVVATEYRSFHTMAVDPRRALLAIAPYGAPVELRMRDDLTVAEVLTDLVGVVALAFSPDGRWLAAATRGETLLLVDATTGKVTAEAEAGERTDSVAFASDGSTLATACSFQGGAHVRLDRVTGDGRLEPLGEIDRAGRGTPPESFVDTIPAVVFTPDGRLVIWETSAIYHEVRPTGWRGDLILADPADGTILWERSIDANITSRRAPLTLAGSPMGYFTTPGVTADGKTIAIGLDDKVVLLDTADGRHRATRSIMGNANGILPDIGRVDSVGVEPSRIMVAATDHGWQQVTRDDRGLS